MLRHITVKLLKSRKGRKMGKYTKKKKKHVQFREIAIGFSSELKEVR